MLILIEYIRLQTGAEEDVQALRCLEFPAIELITNKSLLVMHY